MEIEGSRRSLDRLSIDTTANINEDVTLASELSGDSRYKPSGSIYSSLRTSIDGNPGHINNFNILKSGIGQDDEWSTDSSTILGPNAIFDLTQASDVARTKSNKALRSQVSVNNGAQIFYNLSKPSTKDIPPIQLTALKNKISHEKFKTEVIDELAGEYSSFEHSYNPLTTDILSNFSKTFHDSRATDSQNGSSDAGTSPHEIPIIFEDPSFRLDDPRVFRQVMQSSESSNQHSTSDQLENNSEMQEQLSRYLDSVEMQLISEISKTSNSFFTTLGDINSIKSRSKSCAESIRTIESNLRTVETSQVIVGREILNLLDEKRSVDRLESSLSQLQKILRGINEARECSQKGQHTECLEIIINTESLIFGFDASDRSISEDSYVDVSQLTALKSGRLALAELKDHSNEGYIIEFLTFLVNDLRSHYKSVSVGDTINRIQNTRNITRNNDNTTQKNAYLRKSQEFQDTLHLFIQNLIKGSCLVEAFSRYQGSIITETKAIIRQGLPTEATIDSSKIRGPLSIETHGSSNTSESDLALSREKNNTGTVEAKRLTLSGNLKTLSNSAFGSMVESIFATLSECLRRSTIHQKVLLDLSLTSLSPEDSQNIDVMSLDLTTAINKAIEITQVRLVKVLNVRSEQLGDLPIKEYYEMFSLSSAYLSECESINPGFTSTEAGRSLTEWVKNHVGYFIHRFHSNSVKNLAVVCDKETWREFTGDELQAIQNVIDKLVSYSDYKKADRIPDGFSWAMSMINTSSEENHGSSEKEEHTPITKLSLDEKSYFIPHLLVTVIRATADYVILSKIFGTKAFGIMQNLLTYLKVLNSRVSLSVLNAGATRTAGLKHITTKHIALCIQTVDFLAVYSNYMREAFQTVEATHESPQSNTEYPTFDTSIQQFKDHKNELITKLVSIMRDRTLSHCDAIRKIDLSTPPASNQQCRPYMETLVKETLTVTKVIGKYLSTSDCLHIMLQIFENYKKLLVNCYCADLPQLKDFNEKHSLLKDIDYFRVRLGEVEGYGNSGQIIWENVNSLPTLEDITMEEKMRQTVERESAAPKAETENNKTPEKLHNDTTQSDDEHTEVKDVNVSETVETVESEPVETVETVEPAEVTETEQNVSDTQTTQENEAKALD